MRGVSGWGYDDGSSVKGGGREVSEATFDRVVHAAWPQHIYLAEYESFLPNKHHKRDRPKYTYMHVSSTVLSTGNSYAFEPSALSFQAISPSRRSCRYCDLSIIGPFNRGTRQSTWYIETYIGTKTSYNMSSSLSLFLIHRLLKV